MSVPAFPLAVPGPQTGRVDCTSPPFIRSLQAVDAADAGALAAPDGPIDGGTSPRAPDREHAVEHCRRSVT